MSKIAETIAKAANQIIMQRSAELWGKHSLKELGKWATGCGFPLSYQGYEGLPYLFAKISDMNKAGNEIYIKETANTIGEGIANAIKAKIYPRGTVVFPKIGGAIATNKRRIILKGTAIDNNILGITPNSQTDSLWLYHLLLSLDFKKYQLGTSVPALKQGTLGNIQIPNTPLDAQKIIAVFLSWFHEKSLKDSWESAPPVPQELSEQQRIVARIEELAAKIEEARHLRQQAVQEADLLLDSASRTIFGSSEFEEFVMRMDDSDLIINRETRDPVQEDPTGDFIYIDISSIGKGPSVASSGQTLPCIKAPSRARRVIHKDDVIFSTVRPNLKAIAMIGEDLDDQMCSTGFAVFTCGESIEPKYLLLQYAYALD